MANLIDLLPYEPSVLSKMDKNSLLELILNYLQMKQYLEKGKSNSSCSYTCLEVCESLQLDVEDALLNLYIFYLRTLHMI